MCAAKLSSLVFAHFLSLPELPVSVLALPEDLRRQLLEQATKRGRLTDDVLRSCLRAEEARTALAVSCSPRLSVAAVANALSMFASTLAVADLSRNVCVNDDTFQVHLSGEGSTVVLTALRKLDVSECSITDKCASFFLQKTPALKDLNASSTGVGDGLVAALCFGCKQLQALSLNDCGRVRWELDFFKQVTTEKRFSYHSADGSEMCTVFPSSDSLTFLSLARTGISDESVNYIARGFPSLQFLDLSFNPTLSDISLALTGSRLSKLKTLVANGLTKVTDDGVQFFTTSAEKTQLASISLTGALLTDKSLLCIMSAFSSSLKTLQLSGKKGISKAAVFLIGRHCKELTTLWLDAFPDLNDYCFSEIGANLTKLESLTLTEIPIISVGVFQTTLLRKLKLKKCACVVNDGLVQLLERNRKLESLVLASCPLLSASGVLSSITATHTSLTELDLSSFLDASSANLNPFFAASSAPQRLRMLLLESNANMTNDVFFGSESLSGLFLSWNPQLRDGFVRQWPNLTHLELNGADKITDATCADIARNCKLLRHLALALCTGLSSVGISELITENLLLNSVVLSYCNIDDSTIELLTQRSVRLLNVTGCSLLTAKSIHHFLSMPFLNNLAISYCPSLLVADLMYVSYKPGLRKLYFGNGEGDARVARIRQSLNPHVQAFV